MSFEHKAFITYVRTKMFLQQRLKDKNPLEHVYISQSEIQKRFFPFPKFDIKQEINYLIKTNELNVLKKRTSKGNEAYFYKCVNGGNINLSLIEPKGKELNQVHKAMLHYLNDVTLSENAPSTLYFDSFLMYRNSLPLLFFTVDTFSNRVHTPVTSFKKEYRTNILLKGEKTNSLDVVTMQPLLLGKILKTEIGENDFSTWLNKGNDIYTMLQTKANLSTRNEAKKLFFEILFAPSNNRLAETFGASNWINWINELKQKTLSSNPHTNEKQYSNLAWLLQSTEVKVMFKVWYNLIENKIPFLSVHDEIIIRESDFTKAQQIFHLIMSYEFEYYKLSHNTS